MNVIAEFFRSIEGLHFQLLVTFLLILGYSGILTFMGRIIRGHGRKHGISLRRVAYTLKYFQFACTALIIIILGLIWDISFSGLSVYFLSFFTVAGIGLFASWSILSNITAAIILFFYFPYRIGDKIRISDGDNSVEGTLLDLNLFTMLIKNNEGHKVTYPNNLALQKAIALIKKE